MPALKRRAVMIQQPPAGRRRTKHSGGNRGKYRCALLLAPVYGDLSSHSVAVHVAQAELAGDDSISAIHLELNAHDFSLQ